MLIGFTQNQPRIYKQVLATGSDDLISAYARNEQIHSNSVEISLRLERAVPGKVYTG